jgi:hypothetical protein
MSECKRCVDKEAAIYPVMGEYEILTPTYVLFRGKTNA